MASDQSLATFVCDQASAASPVTARKMFGEFAVYCRGKVVAFICNNQLYVKPTPTGRTLVDPLVEGAPFPGAKLYLMVAERLDDRDWLSRLIETTARELPAPAPRKLKAPRAPQQASGEPARTPSEKPPKKPPTKPLGKPPTKPPTKPLGKLPKKPPTKPSGKPSGKPKKAL